MACSCTAVVSATVVTLSLSTAVPLRHIDLAFTFKVNQHVTCFYKPFLYSGWRLNTQISKTTKSLTLIYTYL